MNVKPTFDALKCSTCLGRHDRWRWTSTEEDPGYQMNVKQLGRMNQSKTMKIEEEGPMNDFNETDNPLIIQTGLSRPPNRAILAMAS